MSHNQTIDGVSRKSLEQALKLAAVFDDGGDGADAESARGVVWILRALLEAPACKTPGSMDCPVDGVGPCKKCPAAQPQGEQPTPVAEQLIERLAQRFPDLENMYTVEIFADWLRAELSTK